MACVCLQEVLIQEMARLRALLAAELKLQEAPPSRPAAAAAEEPPVPASQAAATPASDPLDAFMTDLSTQIESDKV